MTRCVNPVPTHEEPCDSVHRSAPVPKPSEKRNTYEIIELSRACMILALKKIAKIEHNKTYTYDWHMFECSFAVLNILFC